MDSPTEWMILAAAVTLALLTGAAAGWALRRAASKIDEILNDQHSGAPADEPHIVLLQRDLDDLQLLVDVIRISINVPPFGDYGGGPDPYTQLRSLASATTCLLTALQAYCVIRPHASQQASKVD